MIEYLQNKIILIHLEYKQNNKPMRKDAKVIIFENHEGIKLFTNVKKAWEYAKNEYWAGKPPSYSKVAKEIQERSVWNWQGAQIRKEIIS